MKYKILVSKYDLHFLEIAKVYARLSHAKRKQVGAVKDNSIISDGYNGTPRGYSNECEGSNGNTHWYVLHAEANAITKTAKIHRHAIILLYTLLYLHLETVVN